jgi:hypothetical protein
MPAGFNIDERHSHNRHDPDEPAMTRLARVIVQASWYRFASMSLFDPSTPVRGAMLASFNNRGMVCGIRVNSKRRLIANRIITNFTRPTPCKMNLVL